jgi:two-component system, LytTR family, response regulator
MEKSSLRAFLVDDEPLALRRLIRLLKASGQVEIVGGTTDPEEALRALSQDPVDVIFLDIEMPGMNGFELLAKIPGQPIVIFTTAFDQYALRAFDVNSIDYLLKPIEPQQLERALNKIENFRGHNSPGWREAIEEIAKSMRDSDRAFPAHVSSRTGERIQFIELASITHFLSENKLTYAVTPKKRYVVNHSLTELEQRLDSHKFVRIHRAVLVNIRYVYEMHKWFGGGALVRLKDENGTELAVARDRVRTLGKSLGM